MDLTIGPIGPRNPRAPVPVAPAAPAPPSAAAGVLAALALGAVLVVGSVAGMRWWDGKKPAPTPTSDGVQLGRDFRGPLAKALAQGFRDADRAMGQGKTVKEADDALKQTFADARKLLFANGPAKEFEAIVPDGKEPADSAATARYRKLLVDFATGLETAVK